MITEDISIIVEAQGAQTRQLVASLICNRLAEAGFTNIDPGVASREDATSTIVESEKMPSLLEAMADANPAIFARPVKLLAMPYSMYEPKVDYAELALMKDRPDLAEVAPVAGCDVSEETLELLPGQGRLEDGTIIDLATYARLTGGERPEGLVELNPT